MPKYLVACDLDDTLLTKKKKITRKSKKYIKQFVKEGNYFVICTGRPLVSAIRFYNSLKINMPMFARLSIHVPQIISMSGKASLTCATTCA